MVFREEEENSPGFMVCTVQCSTSYGSFCSCTKRAICMVSHMVWWSPPRTSASSPRCWRWSKLAKGSSRWLKEWTGNVGVPSWFGYFARVNKYPSRPFVYISDLAVSSVDCQRLLILSTFLYSCPSTSNQPTNDTGWPSFCECSFSNTLSRLFTTPYSPSRL